jgi:ElaB/YqjD/DUF883 family membrane-anchored ribosome-binding protein
MASTSITHDYGNRMDEPEDARQIRRDIEHTRQEMDETLDELGERLRFEHMMDSAKDYVRTTSARTTAQAAAKIRSAASQVTETIKHNPVSAAAIGMGLGSVTAARKMGLSGEGLRCTADQVTQTVRQHPVPTMLIGAGLLWYAVERSRGGSRYATRTDGRRNRGPYEITYGRVGGCNVPAWHPDYDWSRAAEDEDTWTNRARTALQSVKSSLSDAGHTAAEKVRHASTALVGLCGYSNDQIRTRMHRQWADLKERSGSYVDARTGEPYDSSYGNEWRHLGGLQHLAECADPEAESSGWGDKASQVVDDLKHSLASAGDNVRETLRTMSGKLGEFGNSVGETSSRLGSRARQGAAAAWETAATGTQRMGRRAKEFGGQAQEKIGRGYQVSREQVSHQIDEHPFATGGAALGLGLLAGYLLPRTRVEDRWMGEAADDLKEQAWDIAERGKEAVQATGHVAMDQIRDQAKDLAQDALDRGKEVVHATQQAAMHEAQVQGLSAERRDQPEELKAKSEKHSGGMQPGGKDVGSVGGPTSTKQPATQTIGDACANPQASNTGKQVPSAATGRTSEKTS